MTRLLLTLLAVLTGLMAQVSPAYARVGGASRAEVSAQLPGSGAVAVAATAPSGRPVNVVNWRSIVSAALSPQRAIVLPPVMIGIDRARE